MALSSACCRAPAAAAIHHGLTLPDGRGSGHQGRLARQSVHVYPSEMAQNFWTAIWAWTAVFPGHDPSQPVTRPRKEEELVGLVYSLTDRVSNGHLTWYKRPEVLGVVVLGLTLLLNIIFW